MILAVLPLLVAKTHSYIFERYYSLSDPSFKFMGEFPTSFTRSLIRIKQEAGAPSNTINLAISNTRGLLLGDLLAVRLTCDLTSGRKDQLGHYYYKCGPIEFGYIEADSTMRDNIYFNYFYLSLGSGDQISGLSSLSKGFILMSSYSIQFSNYILRYTGEEGLKDVTSEYLPNQFPTGILVLGLIFQFYFIGFFACVRDCRRVPLYTIYAIGVANLPFIGLIKRGTLVVSSSGYPILFGYMFTSIIVMTIPCLIRAFGRKMKPSRGPCFLILFTILTYFITTDYQFLILPWLFSIPVVLLVEHSTRSKHRGLSFVTLLAASNQFGAYITVLGLPSALRSTMLDVDSGFSLFSRSTMYFFLAGVVLLICLFGPHVKANRDWGKKENQLADEPQPGRDTRADERPRPGAPELTDQFVTPVINNRRTNGLDQPSPSPLVDYPTAVKPETNSDCDYDPF